jgi:two-component system sensor histidine kinase DesK
MNPARSIIKNMALKVHRVLLPPDNNEGAMPYVLLVYLVFYFFNYLFYTPRLTDLLWGFVSIFVFLAIYFRSYWVEDQKLGWYIVAMWLLGMIMSPVNPGSSVYIVYAAAFCCRLGSPLRAALGLVNVLSVTMLLSWLFGLPNYFYLPALLMSALVGGLNIYFHDIGQSKKALLLSQLEIERLATAAERERIARDLHDLIGHTFSVITIKAELANKLLDVDPDRARKELADLENISRDSLSQVREAVSGYRESDLATELVNARLALEAKDIRFDYSLPPEPLASHLDQEFSIILREAVTNIIRHSNASLCRVTVTNDDQRTSLEIFDNGTAKSIEEGNGLKGIRERASELKGQFNINSEQGTSLQILVPV